MDLIKDVMGQRADWHSCNLGMNAFAGRRIIKGKK